MATSLDGYIATPDGGIEWLSPFEGSEVTSSYSRFYSSVDALVMGRRTYEQVLELGEWPYPGKPCWVFSRRRLEVTRPEVTVTAQAPSAAVSELEARGLRRIWLVGGSELAGAFRAEGLITEYIVTVVPAILGAGIPLLASRGPMERLRLVASQPCPNGLVELTYVRGTDAGSEG